MDQQFEEVSVCSSSVSGEANLRHRKIPKSESSASSNYSSLSQEGQNGHSEDKKLNSNYTFRPSDPAHKILKDSPLSSAAIFHQSHAGLFNLCIIVLIAVNSRLIIENLMKYGLLIQTGFWFSSKSLKDWPLLMCGVLLPVFPLCSFLLEKWNSLCQLPEWVLFFMHLIVSMGSLLYPIYVIQRVNSALLSGLILMMFSITCWMKLVSYAHTNYDLRMKKCEKESEPSKLDKTHSPKNITLKNMAYFVVAPTLCYQVSYPQREKIRKGWVLGQLVKLMIFTGLMGFIVEQYINPTIKNSKHPFKGNYLYAVERVLKLSIPTLYVWLCMFYCFFHLWLNVIAEVTFFGDREFYKDWWNAKTVEEYWRMWNMPVHKWIVRHVYFPCLRCGIPKNPAIVICFIVSGIFHEMCIGIPCHMLRCWAFLGIMFQVPLVVLTNYLQKRFQNLMVGNMIFWFFFCIVGQPVSILLYYHDFINQNSGSKQL